MKLVGEDWTQSVGCRKGEDGCYRKSIVDKMRDRLGKRIVCSGRIFAHALGLEDRNRLNEVTRLVCEKKQCEILDA